MAYNLSKCMLTFIPDVYNSQASFADQWCGSSILRLVSGEASSTPLWGDSVMRKRKKVM